MEKLGTLGFIFGLFGFLLGILAWHRANKLEAELKRLKILDEKFTTDK